jgi:hypothetical protein
MPARSCVTRSPQNFNSERSQQNLSLILPPLSSLWSFHRRRPEHRAHFLWLYSPVRVRGRVRVGLCGSVICPLACSFCNPQTEHKNFLMSDGGDGGEDSNISSGDEEVEVVNDDVNYNSYQRNWKELESFCALLRLNEIITRDWLQDWVRIHHDGVAFQLAGSLMKNTSLKQMCIGVGRNVTEIGAKAIARSIGDSAVEDLSLDISANVAEDECIGATRFFYQKSSLKNLRELNIYCNSGDADMVELGLALRNNRKLNDLEICFRFVTDQGANALLRGMQSCKVSKLSLDCASPQVCRALLSGGILSLPTLRNLYLCNDSEYDNWTDDADTGVPSQQQVSQLESLRLECCSLGIADLQLISSAMQGNSNLKEFQLTRDRIGYDRVASLEKLVHGALNLQTFELKDHNLGADGMDRLFKALVLHPSLKSLKLSLADSEENPLSSLKLYYDGQTYPLELRNSCSAMLLDNLNNDLLLEELTLLCSSLHFIEVHQLVKASSSCSFLKRIQVSKCSMGCEGLVMIANQLSSSKLSSFSIITRLAQNTQDAKAEQKALEAACQALVNAIESNMYLQDLFVVVAGTNPGTNLIPPRVMDKISFYENLNRSGRQLFLLDASHVPVGLWCHVMAKHHGNASAIFYFLLEQPMLIIPPLPNASRKKHPGKSTDTEATTRKRKLTVVEH